MASRKKNNSKRKVVKKTVKKKVNSKKKPVKRSSSKSRTKRTQVKKTPAKRKSTVKKTSKKNPKKASTKRKTPIKKSSSKTNKKSPSKKRTQTKKVVKKSFANHKATITKKVPVRKVKSKSIVEQELINKLLKEIKLLEHDNYQLAKQLEKTQTKKEIIFELKSYLSNLKNSSYNNSNNSSSESVSQTRFELEEAKERSKNKDKLISRLKTLVSGKQDKTTISTIKPEVKQQLNNQTYEENSMDEIRHTFPSSIDAHLEEMKPVEIQIEESDVNTTNNESEEIMKEKPTQVSENSKVETQFQNIGKSNNTSQNDNNNNKNSNAQKSNMTPEEIIFQKVAKIEQAKEENSKKYQTNKKRGVISIEEAEYFSDKIKEMEGEINKVFIGQSQAVKDVLISVFCDAHSLLEGVPGLAKTLLIETLGLVISGTIFKRIQFLPDLLPSDIIGGQVFNPKTAEYSIYKGPIFANFVLADEINRAPPKTHAAIMEAMQEKKINIENETFALDRPFFVLATQNPLENKGTYELPEAVLDRFMLKIMLDYPLRKHELQIITENATTKNLKKQVKAVLSKEEVLEIQRKVKKVFISDKIREFIMDLVEATRGKNKNIEGIKFVKYGAGVRASIYLCLAAQANAVYEGRNYVLPDDVLAIAYSVLRHRVVINYRGKAHNITPEKVVEEILSKVKAL